MNAFAATLGRGVGRRSRDLGPARTSSPRCLLSLAPGRGAVAARASRAAASAPLREAHAVAARIGADPLLHELDLLAERARLDPTPLHAAPADAKHGLQDVFGLTPREAEVLTLVARGLTNREIAAALVISVKTASVHVSHILRKLGVPNRLEAAAIAHRFDPPPRARRFQTSTAPRGLPHR